MATLKTVQAIIDLDRLSPDEEFCYRMNIPIQKLGYRDYFEIIDSYYKIFGKGIVVTDISSVMARILEALDNIERDEEKDLTMFKESIQQTAFRG